MPSTHSTLQEENRKFKRRFNTEPETIIKFKAETSTLAWLDSFASNRAPNPASVKHLEDAFPWLWDPTWGNTIAINMAGVKQLKNAVRNAESMVHSLDAFLQCTKNRLGDLQVSLQAATIKSYFPLLSDTILAIVFKFASSRNVEGMPDYKTPSRILRVSRRFRSIALRLPTLWGFLDSELQSLEDMLLATSRSATAGLEVRMDCKRAYGKESRVYEHILYINGIKSLSSRFTSLHFDYSLFYHRAILVELSRSYKHLEFPSLQELRIDYDDGTDEDSEEAVHFYRNWVLPSLKILKARNVIPRLRPEVLAAVTECSLSLTSGRKEGFTGRWELLKAMDFLGALSEVKDLNVEMCSNQIVAEPNTLPIVRLLSVERLTTTFIGLDSVSASEFHRTFRTPFKHSWTIEIEDKPEYPLKKQLEVIFPVMPFFEVYDPGRTGVSSAEFFKIRPSENRVSERPRRVLKDVHIVIRRAFGRSDCFDLMNNVPHFNINLAETLENFSVTYPNGEQGFFGWRSPSSCSVQVSKVELKNCKGMVKALLDCLEEKFVGEPGNGNARLIVDGSEIQEREGSGIDVGQSWASLVLDAKIVRE